MKKACLSLLMLTVCTFVSFTLNAQSDAASLPRRGYLGVALSTNASNEVLVNQVIEGSTAAELGIKKNDIIKEVNGVPVATSAELVATVGSYDPGDSLAFKIIRGEETRVFSGSLKPYPAERVVNSTVAYDSVAISDNVRLRMIVTTPGNLSAPAPAVMFIQDGGCETVEGSPITPHRLFGAIGSQGFVTVRIEKSGVGDSEGLPCSTIGYHEELAGYRAGFQALKNNPDVDQNRIFLVGLGVGGIYASILASEEEIAGIAVWGALAKAPMSYAGRSQRFIEEISGLDVLDVWTRVKAPVLIIHGEYDLIALKSHSTLIETVINNSHPGSAVFVELEELDHCYTQHKTMDDSKYNCGNGQKTPLLPDTILSFLDNNS